jgi:hypothetical protein
MKAFCRWEEVAKLGFSAVLTMSLFCGCSGGDAGQKPTAKVSGTVTFDGKPVSGGTLIFSPITPEGGKQTEAGKSGQATITSSGTYVVTTYSDGDGAVVGKHRVLFSAPPAPAPSGDAHAQPAASPYAGLSPKDAEVTVSKGDNKINIELIGAQPAMK